MRRVMSVPPFLRKPIELHKEILKQEKNDPKLLRG